MYLEALTLWVGWVARDMAQTEAVCTLLHAALAVAAEAAALGLLRAAPTHDDDDNDAADHDTIDDASAAVAALGATALEWLQARQ
eukprot:8377479-Pyramimonas_sp.AAC.1